MMANGGQLREERKQELEEHVAAVNAILKEVSSVGAGLDSDEEGEVWGGIEEEEDKVEEVLDREEEYVDEDRWTTVTVEAVDISKEGFKKVREDEDEEVSQLVVAEKDDGGKEKKKWPKKEKKKKFRYESKAERKFTRGKQKAGNKARADARKGSS
jgi:ribosomal RNA-processing protein 17